MTSSDCSSYVDKLQLDDESGLQPQESEGRNVSWLVKMYLMIRCSTVHISSLYTIVRLRFHGPYNHPLQNQVSYTNNFEAFLA